MLIFHMASWQEEGKNSLTDYDLRRMCIASLNHGKVEVDYKVWNLRGCVILLGKKSIGDGLVKDL